MIKVTFPDGAVRDYARGTTGTTVVEGISPKPRQEGRSP
jgi:threonyl-tRNA synthetase